LNVSRSALVPFSATQMFQLVDDVENYHRFLPWCESVELISKNQDITAARLNINYRGLRQSFATENHKNGFNKINMQLIDGPFKSLYGSWQFIPLMDTASKIEFNLNYEFSSFILQKIVGPVFGHIVNNMVDAFQKEAERRYVSQ